MYDWPELSKATSEFWECIRDAFIAAEFDAPAQLTGNAEANDHWLHSNLIFSQTCGYPYAVDLGENVDLLGTPIYDVEGCGKGTYSSAIVVSENSRFQKMDDTRGSVLVFNGESSLSGYRSLSPMVNDITVWFDEQIHSGSHRNSAKMVADGIGDLAAIDAVCWALLKQYAPNVASRLRVLAWTAELPALPYISCKSQSPDEFISKTLALRAGVNQAIESGATKPLMIKGLADIDKADYMSLAEL